MVVGALAAVSGLQPVDIEPPGDAVDVDALEGLFARSSGDGVESVGSAEFEYAGYRITVDRSGVTVGGFP